MRNQIEVPIKIKDTVPTANLTSVSLKFLTYFKAIGRQQLFFIKMNALKYFWKFFECKNFFRIYKDILLEFLLFLFETFWITNIPFNEFNFLEYEIA